MYGNRVKNMQRVLRAFADYRGLIDGDPGIQSLAAADRVGGGRRAQSLAVPWTPERRVIAAGQTALQNAGFDVGVCDGFYGPHTDVGYQAWHKEKYRDRYTTGSGKRKWGNQRDVGARFGPPGGAICTEGKITPPWAMFLAWEPRQQIKVISCHVDVADSAQRVLNAVAKEYKPEVIADLGLHLFGGCFNNRNMRGSNRKSMHAWGVAFDFDPGRNQLRWSDDRARLALVAANEWWGAWDAEGWTSLGRSQNYDWMHVQAPAL